MRVLAIGASGFIGAHVVRLLVDQGNEVAVFHRGETHADLPAGTHHILGNRNRLQDSRSELERFGADVVLDAIPYTERQARGMVEVFRGTAGRVVVVSSADVYRNYDGFRGKATAPPDPVPLAEDAVLRETRYPYRGSGLPFGDADDYDKILVEQVLLNEPDLQATILRLPAVYGPGDKQRRLGSYVRRMKDGRPAILLSEGQSGWRWTRGFVVNVAAAVALAVVDHRGAGRIYNVGEEPAPTEREWVERIGAATDWTGTVVTLAGGETPHDLRQSFDWRYDLWIDTGRIRSELGYSELVPADEAMNLSVDWERAQVDAP
jgi:nucleoside-diphosphate-sugar epimerase